MQRGPGKAAFALGDSSTGRASEICCGSGHHRVNPRPTRKARSASRSMPSGPRTRMAMLRALNPTERAQQDLRRRYRCAPSRIPAERCLGHAVDIPRHRWHRAPSVNPRPVSDAATASVTLCSKNTRAGKYGSSNAPMATCVVFTVTAAESIATLPNGYGSPVLHSAHRRTHFPVISGALAGVSDREVLRPR